METPPVGSLVVPSPPYREAMKTGEGAALLLVLRRGSGQVYYPSTEREFWVPMRDVRPLPAQAVRPDSLEALLSRLLLGLEAEECAVEERTSDGMLLLADLPGITLLRLEELRKELGSTLVSMEIDPGGRHAVTLRMKLTLLPAAQGA